MSFYRKSFEKVKPVNHINYVHYDPEMHWCRVCNVFPKTAKDYLTHLHSPEHGAIQGTVESPWHDKPFTDVSIIIYICKKKQIFYVIFIHKRNCQHSLMHHQNVHQYVVYNFSSQQLDGIVNYAQYGWVIYIVHRYT